MPLLALKKGNISSRVRDLVIRGSKILRYNIRSWQINNEDTLNACLMSNPEKAIIRAVISSIYLQNWGA